MSQEKNHPVMMDVTGRVLSLEQRIKGLQGRIAAIEAKLSLNGVNPVQGDIPAEDFVRASGQFDCQAAADSRVPCDRIVPAGYVQHETKAEMVQAKKPVADLIGIIAGGIMIGAGVLLLTGNVEIIKNPLVAMGCGILLIIGAVKPKSYK